MQATPEHLGMLSELLSQSLSPNPEIRHPAEKTLDSSEMQSGFLFLVLTLVASNEAAMHVRQAAGVYFKNVIKKRWTEENDISLADKEMVKSQLVPIMVSLSTSGASRLQAQIGEAVAEIAELDFPERWPTLVDDLVNSFSGDRFAVNNGVLTTAHSIFKRWRSQFQSNELFSTIKLVLEKFCGPYTALFQRVDELLTGYPASPLPAGTTVQELSQSLLLLVELYHDLNCQDFPEYFEDHNALFMGDASLAAPSSPATYGLLGKYLRWEIPELMGEEDDDVGGPIQQIRAAICEIAELYALKYSDSFPQLSMFVEGVWRILSVVGLGTRHDQFVGKALGFLSVVVKMGSHKQLFEAQQTLEDFCRLIILPNMTIRPREEEMFEDDPMEFIRQDLEASTEHDTRRAAATEFTRALMQLFEQQITSIIGGHIERFLQIYASNPSGEWRAKDTAVYLLTSIASRGSTQHQGVTNVNSLINVVDWFSQNVFADLQAESTSVHPILQVDAIKYLYTFRNQLTKDQLLSVLPLLVQHLKADNYVTYSFAAITIERILFIKQNGLMLFSQADVRPFAESILMACFTQIQRGDTPQKIAENDHLMKCVMRVIITARQSLLPSYSAILERLVAITGETSKNPSNPKFNQYNFESISALIRYVCAGQPEALPSFEGALFPPIQAMLSNDVAEFIPYAFQICSQLLELHPVNELPVAYENLLAPLLHSSLWESRGNVPALVRLWKALLVRGGVVIAQRGHVQALLGIFQKLITMKSTDVAGLELVGVIYESIPIETMLPFTRTVFMLILNRMQTTKVASFRQAVSNFYLLLCALPGVGARVVVEQLEAIQPGLIVNLLEGVILPETRKTSAKDRKAVVVGLTNLLTQGDVLLQPALVSAWPMVLEATLDLFLLVQDLNTEEDAGIDQLDPEESTFQASFNKLGASEPAARDPVAGIPDAKLYLSQQLSATSNRHPGKLAKLMEPLPQQNVQTFLSFMSSNSHTLS